MSGLTLHPAMCLGSTYASAVVNTAVRQFIKTEVGSTVKQAVLYLALNQATPGAPLTDEHMATCNSVILHIFDNLEQCTAPLVRRFMMMLAAADATHSSMHVLSQLAALETTRVPPATFKCELSSTDSC